MAQYRLEGSRKRDLIFDLIGGEKKLRLVYEFEATDDDEAIDIALSHVKNVHRLVDLAWNGDLPPRLFLGEREVALPL